MRKLLCLQGVNGIKYLGKGTYIDCALTNMTQEMTQSSSSSKPLRFAVVITDGHVTGNPCGGIKVSAERARDAGIRIFAVAASKNIDEMGMREIANSPGMVFRADYMAVDLSQGRPIIHTQTIDRIIKTMVTPKRRQTRAWKRERRPRLLTFFFVFTETFVVCGGKKADGCRGVGGFILTITPYSLTACRPVCNSVTVCPVWRRQDHLVPKATEDKK